jgi:hypothetical protein
MINIEVIPKLTEIKVHIIVKVFSRDMLVIRENLLSTGSTRRVPMKLEDKSSLITSISLEKTLTII